MTCMYYEVDPERTETYACDRKHVKHEMAERGIGDIARQRLVLYCRNCTYQRWKPVS